MTATPFADAALELAGHGLVLVPLGGPEGKSPLVGGFTKWRGQRPETVKHFANKFPGANIGIVHGSASGTTVVDVDEPAQINTAITRFGHTPLVVETPRGGVHLFYTHNGERSMNLREHGLRGDCKARGGLTTAPPSVRPSGAHKGRLYRLVKGTWADLRRLPAVRPGSLPRQRTRGSEPAVGSLTKVTGDGHRNGTLFKECLRRARQCRTLDDLLNHARMQNRKFMLPLPDDEVSKTAASAWRYQKEGRNWIGSSDSQIVLTERQSDELAGIKHGGDAMLLWCKLRAKHGARGKPFAVSPRAMAENNVMPGWSEWRLRQARNALLEIQWLERLQKGVTLPGTGGLPALYRLTNPGV